MEHKIFFFLYNKKKIYFGKTRNRKWKIEFSLKIFLPQLSLDSLFNHSFFLKKKKEEPK